MKELITPALAEQIGKLIIEWGTPGVIVLFLYEERRRLMKEVETLQKRLNESLEARIKTNVDALTTVKDNESAIERMSGLLNIVLSRRSNNND